MFIRRKAFFKQHEILHEVSFEVKSGETVGIVGRNGAGKSTLLQIICGTLAPSSGVAKVDGRVAALLELGAGFNPEFTGYENVLLSGQIYGLTEEQVRARADVIIEFAELQGHQNQPVKHYSSGMFMRLAFSVIAHVDADILVIDEALAVGDAYFVQKCMRFLSDFKKKGGSLLFVSHDATSVAALCDKVAWLDSGTVRRFGDPKSVMEDYLKDFYSKSQVISGDIAQKAEPSSGQSQPATYYDQRRDFVNSTRLINELSVSFPSLHDRVFGTGGAQIMDVCIQDLNFRRLTWVVGGEYVTLKIAFSTLSAITNTIVGFLVKNKNGLPLFGDNTYIRFVEKPRFASPGEVWEAAFSFVMPVLPGGSYSVTVAVSDGSQESHEVQAWIDEALIINSASKNIATGLMGIPMIEMALQKKEGNNAPAE
ncbi:ABC transporter ATP-binding protein [Pseudomonas japonica]|uniref:ABC transporter ATP-binding protein n=1 Tax=Pseudomonas japonica TaxID=256466 RepID=UPI0015E2E2D3|nr:ABC transporter ATP-binding protein [Pseudomonas japonica]MBA1241966.1 ABC transporter ATP-binding protein [Pseudomonas japonica]